MRLKYRSVQTPMKFARIIHYQFKNFSLIEFSRAHEFEFTKQTGKILDTARDNYGNPWSESSGPVPEINAGATPV